MKTKSKTAASKRDGADIAFGVLPSLIGYRLRQAQSAIFSDFQETIGAHAITPGLFGVLLLIDANPDLKQTALARAIHFDQSAVASVVDKLEARKLVARRQAHGVGQSPRGAPGCVFFPSRPRVTGVPAAAHSPRQKFTGVKALKGT